MTVRDDLRDEWEALRLLSYHGLTRDGAVMMADLTEADVESIRDLLRRADRELDALERRLRHSEFHRTSNRTSMRHRGRTIRNLEAKLVRLRRAAREAQGRSRLREHERAAELHRGLRSQP